MTDPDWHRRASCLGRPDSIWYPEGHSGTKDATENKWRLPRAVCRSCPVQQECLTAALKEEENSSGRYGMRGARTPEERRLIAGGGQLAPPIDNCGTSAGYRGHHRRGEQPCPGCRRADSRRRADNNMRRAKGAAA